MCRRAETVAPAPARRQKASHLETAQGTMVSSQAKLAARISAPLGAEIHRMKTSRTAKVSGPRKQRRPRPNCRKTPVPAQNRQHNARRAALNLALPQLRDHQRDLARRGHPPRGSHARCLSTVSIAARGGAEACNLNSRPAPQAVNCSKPRRPVDFDQGSSTQLGRVFIRR